MNYHTAAAFLLVNVLLLVCNAQDFQSHLTRLRPSAPPQVQETAVLELIRRIIPEKADAFRISVVPSEISDGKDAFEVESRNGIVNISATSGVAASHGFHYYLKNVCKCHISWDGDQLNLPEILPPATLNVTASDRFRYFGNVCVASYSWVWWDWFQWEKHLDWMALNGINLVLAPTAQEVIWIHLFTKLGLTQDEIEGHLTGPGFSAWGRMGNIRGWGGPVSINSLWYQRRLELQHSILERMRSFGMIAVLPAFAGHVPLAFQRLYPEFNYTRMGRWNNFQDDYCCPLFLEPTSELFQEVGYLFLKELIEEFGTDHVYSADPFNEMQPHSNDLTYISDVSQSIFRAMIQADSQAIWVLQNWMFVNEVYFWTKPVVRSFLTPIPVGRLLILDLQSELKEQYTHLENYFGHHFIWNMLHNYGGTLGLYGAVGKVNQLVYTGRYSQNSTMVGIGLTPEGIGQNYVMYDFMLETGWRTEPANLTQWFSDYAVRRYGIQDDKAITAWLYLKSSTYNYTGTIALHGRYFFICRPNLKTKPSIWYNTNYLLQAWDNLIDISQTISSGINPFQHDIVDVTREALGLYASYYYTMMTTAFKHNISSDFQSNADNFLHVLGDMDLLLASQKDFLLGKWLEDAKSAATSLEELQLFENNARNQITLWGPNGEILDYAGKQWSGIVSHYFTPRWTLFIQQLNHCLDIGVLTFDQKKFNEDVFSKVELKFTQDYNEFPVNPHGDPVEIAKAIHHKWRPTKKRFVQTLSKLHRHYLNKLSKQQRKH